MRKPKLTITIIKMEETNFVERLTKLENEKLIDIVKNFRQYGYSEQIKELSLDILHHRGISREDLKLTGNLQNQKYEEAKRLFNSFKTNSGIAFISYLFLAISQLIAFSFIPMIITGIALIVFFACLLRSFLNQSDFYKLAGDEFSNGALIYFFLGMPFYLIMYFVFLRQMKEKLKEII